MHYLIIVYGNCVLYIYTLVLLINRVSLVYPEVLDHPEPWDHRYVYHKYIKHQLILLTFHFKVILFKLEYRISNLMLAFIWIQSCTYIFSYISYCYNIIECTITSMLLLCYRIMSYCSKVTFRNIINRYNFAGT